MSETGSSRVWLVVGAVGCLGVLAIAAFVTFVGGASFFLFKSIRSSGAYQDAVRELRKHPAAVEALGEPIEEGWATSGSINVTGPSGEAKLAIPVSGPKGKGTLYVEAVKQAGQWKMQLLQLAPPTGARIDLLAGSTQEPGGPAPGHAVEGPADEPESGPPLVADAFDDPRSGWSTWSKDEASVAYRDGRLVIASAGSWGTVLSHNSRLDLRDGLVEVDVVPLSSEPAWVGIVVRRQANHEGHGLYVGGNALLATGKDILMSFQKPAFARLAQPLQGWRPRRLRVMTHGPQVRLSVDDQLVWAFESSPWAQGAVSLGVHHPPDSGPVQVAFDNFRVWGTAPAR